MSNESNAPSKNETKTNAPKEKRDATLQEQLAALPQVEIMIPLPEGVKAGSPEAQKLFVPVRINGHIWQINRGRKVRVPSVVVDILREAGIHAY